MLKSNFKVLNRYGAFFKNGTVQATKDGENLLLQCDNQLNVLNIDTGVVVHSIGQEDDVELTSYILSPDNEILVTANTNYVLRHWNYAEKKVVRTWKCIHESQVKCMTFDPTSTLLATGSADRKVTVWDMLRQYCTHNLHGHTGVVNVVQFHPDISRLQLYSAAADYTVRAWSLERSECLAVMDGHSSAVTSLQFSSDGDTLYSAARDSTVVVWNIESFTKTKTIPVYESVESLMLLSPNDDNSSLNVTSSDQTHFIVGGSSGNLCVFSAQTSARVFSTTTPQPCSGKAEGRHDQAEKRNEIVSAFLIPKRDEICVVTSDLDIVLHRRRDLGLSKQFVGHIDEVKEIKFLGANDSHIAVANNSQLVKVFEVNTWSCQILAGHSDMVLSLDVFQKEGLNLLVTGSKDNTARVWAMSPDTKIVSCIAVARGHTKNVETVAFSRCGTPKFLVSAGADQMVSVWNINQQMIDIASGFSKSTGEKIQSGGDVLEMQAAETARAHEKGINCVAVSPNDAVIATGSADKTVKLWNYETTKRRGIDSKLEMVGCLRGHKSGVWCVQFSPVAQTLATASSDCTIRLWDIQNRACLKTFSGHEGAVRVVRFISHGLQLISSGSDSLVKLWSVQNQECVKTFDEHEDKIWAMAVDKSETRIVTGSVDSTIIVWKDVTEEDQLEERLKLDDLREKEQELSNLLQQKNYVKALGLTIVMDQPYRALNIIKEILKTSNGEIDLSRALDKLRVDQIDSVLKFAVAWNDNSKNCHAAQAVLGIVLRKFATEELLSFPNIQSIVEGLLPYTEKHHERMTKLHQKATFVDYMWRTMRPTDDAVRTSSAMDDDSTMLVDGAGDSSTNNEDMEVVPILPQETVIANNTIKIQNGVGSPRRKSKTDKDAVTSSPSPSSRKHKRQRCET